MSAEDDDNVIILMAHQLHTLRSRLFKRRSSPPYPPLESLKVIEHLFQHP